VTQHVLADGCFSTEQGRGLSLVEYWNKYDVTSRDKHGGMMEHVLSVKG
jgi:hypothetical protein